MITQQRLLIQFCTELEHLNGILTPLKDEFCNEVFDESLDILGHYIKQYKERIRDTQIF